jgi:hypothetical protein
MSSRENHGSWTPVVGVGTHYINIIELVEDKKRVELLANALEISRRHVRKDSCDQWTIIGKTGHIQTADQCYVLYVAAYSPRKWGAIKRTAKSFGWEISQDGDDEGCILLQPPNAIQAKFLRRLLGLRKLGVRSIKNSHNEGVSPL